MRTARYYEKLPDNDVRCLLCPHDCLISDNQFGICGARQNIDGTLYSKNYAQTVTVSIDPMEKKPLYHFYPGESVLSIGCNSCNFSCDFCQNYSISQLQASTRELSPGALVEVAEKHLCKFVAFTYTEPITWFEYVLESSKLLKEYKIKTVMVTNGFINPEPLNELLPYIDAMNIDLKSMENNFYKKICKGKLQPVLDTIKTVAGKCHLEITNLLVTGENDSESNIKELVNFIAEINPDIPMHFSKYFPQYKMHNPPTSESVLKMAKEIAKKKLHYVYLGNVLADTRIYCPDCNKLLVKRGFPPKIYIKDNKCPECDFEIYGEFE
jgi:pyruvate formate lyase activating enzyme